MRPNARSIRSRHHVDAPHDTSPPPDEDLSQERSLRIVDRIIIVFVTIHALVLAVYTIWRLLSRVTH